MDFAVTPQFNHQASSNQSANGLGDLAFAFSFQLLRQNNYPISLKIALSETFPTGTYQNLSENMGGVDAFGSGAYTTKVTLSSSHNMPLSPGREFHTRFAMSYAIPSSVHVIGINTYGGDSTTNGDVTNAGTFDVVLGMEYSITRQWVLALDIDSLWQHGTEFKGSTVTAVGKPESTYVLSLAPALEYNFNANFGLIGGVWFSAFGRNHTSYINGIIALNVYI